MEYFIFRDSSFPSERYPFLDVQPVGSPKQPEVNTMSSQCLGTSIRFPNPFTLAVVLLIFALWANVASGQPKLVRVEEDWELVVAKPDSNSTAPQITCVTSPFSHVDSMHITFEINHQSHPEFRPGGLSLQLWDGEYAVDCRCHPSSRVLANENEVIRWTQVISLQNGYLVFAIQDGTSKTWGNFGGKDYLLTYEKSTIGDLNQYNAATSVKNSGIGFAANRVTSLTLKEVRVFTQTGESFKDSTDRVVHKLNN